VAAIAALQALPGKPAKSRTCHLRAVAQSEITSRGTTTVRAGKFDALICLDTRRFVMKKYQTSCWDTTPCSWLNLVSGSVEQEASRKIGQRNRRPTGQKPCDEFLFPLAHVTDGLEAFSRGRRKLGIPIFKERH